MKTFKVPFIICRSAFREVTYVCKLYGATLHGIDGCIITVEVDISQGLPVFDIVGLPNQSVKEAREREGGYQK